MNSERICHVDLQASLVDAINEGQILTTAFINAEEAQDYYDEYYFLDSYHPYLIYERMMGRWRKYYISR